MSHRICERFTPLLAAALGLGGIPAACAAASSADAAEATRNLIILLTILAAPLIGILLYWLGQRTSQTQFKGDQTQPSAKRAAQVSDPKILTPTILEQLNQLPGSRQQRERVARTVSDIVTQVLHEQVNTVKQELGERYEQLVEEKRRTEAVLQRKYQETLAEKKQTVSILESVAEGLVVVNTKGEIVMMNPAAERLLGISQNDRVGKPLLADLRDEHLVSLVRESKGQEREIVVSAKQDQTKRVLRASNAMITDENGSTIGMVAVLSDVTRQRELDELKSEFISKVSHELRNPLVAMRHALSLLNDQVVGPLTEEQRKFMEVVQRNLDHLNTLINDLLDLSKLEAKKMELRRASASIADAIQAVCETLTPWAQSKSLTTSKRISADLPPMWFDQVRIKQVLTNLIGNAIKFTPKQGRVTIEAKLGSAPRTVVVSVADTGEGIAQNDLPKLFQKFQQVGERIHTDIEGTGLGLAIAKEIVELHGGRIWAESDGKQGATFTFTLPLGEPPAAAAG